MSRDVEAGEVVAQHLAVRPLQRFVLLRAAVGVLPPRYLATYRLRAADAVHLATAVGAGADRFLTNNARDFPKSIAEVAVTYPTDPPAAEAG